MEPQAAKNRHSPISIELRYRPCSNVVTNVQHCDNLIRSFLLAD